MTPDELADLAESLTKGRSTEPCVRCGRPAENAPSCVMCSHSKVVDGILCGPCRRMAFADHDAFFGLRDK